MREREDVQLVQDIYVTFELGIGRQDSMVNAQDLSRSILT